jgi:mono/diheme cytochrome c family protein
LEAIDGKTPVRRRLSLLVTVVSLALFTAACGRATEEQINQLLGITPTPTMSAADIASATEAAQATADVRATEASAPGGAALGDVTAGARQFETWCAGCHGPGGQGPDIRAAGSAGAAVTAESLLPLVREGEGHTPPGPYRNTEITDSQVADIAAYLRSEAGG